MVRKENGLTANPDHLLVRLELLTQTSPRNEKEKPDPFEKCQAWSRYFDPLVVFECVQIHCMGSNQILVHIWVHAFHIRGPE